MKSIVNRFGNLKFRNKLALSILLVSLIPLLLFSAVIGTILVRDVSQKSSQLTLQMVSQTSESLDIYIGTIEKLMNFVIDESCGISPDDKEQIQRLEEQAETIRQSYPEIAGILIAYSDDSCFSAGMSRISRDRFEDEEWYQYAMELDGQLGIVGSALGRNVINHLGDSSDSVFSLVKSFPAENASGRSGVVLFDIRHDIIEQLISRVSIGEKGFLYVVDKTDVVYTPVNSIIYRIDRACYEQDGMDTGTVSINGHGYFVANHYSTYSGWRTIGVIPEAEFRDSIRSVYQLLGLCVVVCLVLIVVVSWKISATVTRPVSKLSRFMEVAEAGDFSARFDVKYRDEIGGLGRSFNHMMEQINRLIGELYVEKQKRLEAQLKSLQEQIKPHFLYNTLDTISWMARAQGAMDVVRLVDALTNMFRVGLSSGKDYIPLREEKKHVINYLYIQGVRYQSRLKYSIEIPEEYDNIIVPKLILQPLVENSIYHGIKLKRTSGIIRITAEADDQWLHLRVWDDGAGISDGRLEEIRQWLNKPASREEKVGFGLAYIKERIELFYGSEYTMNIDSQEGSYTEVSIYLPLQKEAKNV